MRTRLSPAVWLALGLVLPLFRCALADQGWEDQSLHLTWENDATRGSDRHYTQGARIRYLSSDKAAPDWMRRAVDGIPSVGFQSEALKFGVEVGQEMYTPEDLAAVAVIRRDRPYAGWLYGSALLQRRGPGPEDIPMIENLRLDLGVIGPESMAEQTQKVWHGRDPKGWHNQLRTEVGLALRYDRNYLFRLGDWGGWDFDALPGLEASLGNVDIHLGATALARFGYNIPNKHEVPKEPTRKGFGVFMFGGVGGKVVGHNIFLDGNTWRESHHVDREPLVATVTSGLSLVLGPFDITASNNYTSHEFRTQRHSDSYGSVTLSLRF